MKKTIALVIAILTICMALPAAAVSFTDLGTSHWAYSAVSQLVAKGTIGGYADGSFKPENTVTRAEFVKMVGEGTEKRSVDFNDVPKDHWAYKYVITSGFKSDSQNNFNPDVPITRAQTVELLFRRFGKSGVTAPPFVKMEAEKNAVAAEALSWIYTYGILVGDDGLNLRLGDTLTRAEAAALIVKCESAKTPKDFVDIVSENILKNIAEKMKLFGGSYNSSKTLTNAELAVAAVKFANNVEMIDFSKYKIGAQIDHPRSKELYVMLNSDIGLDNYTVAFANAQATVETAEKAIKNAAEKFISGNIVEKAVIYLDGKNKKDAVTQRDVAALVAQYDAVFGSQFNYTTEYVNVNYKKIISALETDVRKYPQSHKQYAVILKDVPSAVYDYPINSSSSPAELYDFARDYADLFVAKCEEYVIAADKVFGSKLKITYYPSLAYDNGTGFSFRVKITALNTTKTRPTDMFDKGIITNADKTLTAGTEFFVEISVNSII
ncbi:MAG: S-layer homology domain-containing protein [Monoglobales bacterium]